MKTIRSDIIENRKKINFNIQNYNGNNRYKKYGIFDNDILKQPILNKTQRNSKFLDSRYKYYYKNDPIYLRTKQN